MSSMKSQKTDTWPYIEQLGKGEHDKLNLSVHKAFIVTHFNWISLLFYMGIDNYLQPYKTIIEVFQPRTM